RKFHCVTRETPRHPLSIPALVDLAETFANVLGQTDTLRDPLRDLAVPGQDGDIDLRALSKATLDRLLQLFRRRTRKLSFQCANQELDEFRPIAHVDVMELAAQSDLVTPVRRQQVRIGVAADVAQQRLVIDAAAGVLVEPCDICKPHPQQAGAQREILRVTGGQIGRVCKGHQKIGASNLWCRHSLPQEQRQTIGASLGSITVAIDLNVRAWDLYRLSPTLLALSNGSR